MELLFVVLVRWLLVVGVARLMYELITPISPAFLIVLISLVVICLMLTRRRT